MEELEKYFCFEEIYTIKNLMNLYKIEKISIRVGKRKTKNTIYSKFFEKNKIFVEKG